MMEHEKGPFPKQYLFPPATLDRPTYEAMLVLLRAEKFTRLDIACGEREGFVTVGFHAGHEDGDFVVESEKGQTEMVLASCDEDLARELSGALMAYADWCQEDRVRFYERKKDAVQETSSEANAPHDHSLR